MLPRYRGVFLFGVRSFSLQKSLPILSHFHQQQNFLNRYNSRTTFFIENNQFCQQTETKTGKTTTTNDEQPLLNKILRQFYIKVHPDLFSSSKEHQLVNQGSLKEFTSFIEQWKQNPNPNRLAKSKKKTIHFFVKEKLSTNDLAVDTTNEAKQAFRKVEVDLIDNGEFSAIKGEISKLFDQVGLPTEFKVGNEDNLNEFETISDFLTKHKESSREEANKEREAEDFVEKALFKLKRTYSIIVSEETLGYFYSMENKEILANLTKALDNLRTSNPDLVDSLKNYTICLEADNKIDYDDKSLVLDRSNSAPQIAQILSKLNLENLKKPKTKGLELNTLREDNDKLAEKISLKFGLNSITLADRDSYFILNEETGEFSEEVVYNLDVEIKRLNKFLSSIHNATALIRTWKKGLYRPIGVRVRSMPKRAEVGLCFLTSSFFSYILINNYY